MLGEILESVSDLVDLADRKFAKLFSEPWPPEDPGKQTAHRMVYTRQQTYCRTTQTTSNRVVILNTTAVPRTTISPYPRQTYRETKAPPKSNDGASRPISRIRKSVSVSQQPAPQTRRTIGTTVIPRPISVPSAVTGKTDVRERRLLTKPNPAGTRPTQSLRLDDFRPDLVQCDVLVIAVAEMELCKEIFSGWRAQLNVGEPRKANKLELSIVETVRKLDISASAALHASHDLLRNYRTLLRSLERSLDQISQSKLGGTLFSSEVSSLAIRISAHSSALSNYVKQMQERLRELVKNIEKTKESADKRALKKKIWKWIARVVKALATLISAGGALFALIHPIGFLESVAIGGVSMLTGAVARLCELVEERYNETTFDEILTFLRSHIPESAKAAEIALTSFQACHRLLQVELQVRKGKRSGWVNAVDARRARGQWAQAEERLRTSRSSRDASFLDDSLKRRDRSRY